MSDDEPHRIEDNASLGEQVVMPAETVVPKKSTVIIRIEFDDDLKEFALWDYLYDFETHIFAMEATTDHKNRIQYYKITADRKAIRKFKIWLIQKDIRFKFKLDK